MFFVLIFVFVAAASAFDWNGIESHKRIIDGICEDRRLNEVKAEIKLLKKSLETTRTFLKEIEKLQKICGKHLEATTLPSTEGQMVTSANEYPQGNIRLIKRLNQSSFSTTQRHSPYYAHRNPEDRFFIRQESTYYVQGMTKHDDRIFVLCASPNIIRVFEDRNQFRLLSEFQLTQIGWPMDIVYNDRSKCFYVLDNNNRCIWKIATTDGNPNNVTKWLNGTTDPQRMSLSSDGHLLVPREVSHSPFNNYSEFDRIKYSQLDIYNGSNARLIRRLQLHNDIQKPLQAIQTTTRGEVLISHKLVDEVYGQWVISRVSSDGQTIISQSNPRKQSEELNWPYDLSLDSDNNRLFVADYQNHRVVLFDAESLDFRQVLISEERNGIHGPTRLHYDKERKQLFVGHSAGIVDIYEVK